MKYTDVCEAKTKEAMVAAFDQICAEVAAKHGGSPESHRRVQMQNVGYFSGYYSPEVYANVNEWLGAEHPIFGKNRPTARDAFTAGLALGRKPHRERTE